MGRETSCRQGRLKTLNNRDSSILSKGWEEGLIFQITSIRCWGLTGKEKSRTETRLKNRTGDQTEDQTGDQTEVDRIWTVPCWGYLYSPRGHLLWRRHCVEIDSCDVERSKDKKIYQKLNKGDGSSSCLLTGFWGTSESCSTIDLDWLRRSPELCELLILIWTGPCAVVLRWGGTSSGCFVAVWRFVILLFGFKGKVHQYKKNKILHSFLTIFF